MEKHMRFYGRRKGRPLRDSRQQLVDELLPKIRISIPEDGKIACEDLFSFSSKEVWMEIGFGGGEHLAAQAESNPDIVFLGCEPFINGVAKLLSYVEEKKLENVRIYPDDARHVLDHLPDHCLDRCFVLFADPWPKARHAERRFIGKENLDRLVRVLKEGGELRLATDVADLAAWMREACAAHPAFEVLYDSTEPPEAWVPTRYELKGRAAGRGAEYMIFMCRGSGIGD
ncbi:MAG: tRNA (guanosine(46)-N7)-methyltransferase TrmB [Bdellovibrionales bacterium]